MCVLVMQHSSSVHTIKQQKKIQLKSFKLYLIKFDLIIYTFQKYPPVLDKLKLSMVLDILADPGQAALHRPFVWSGQQFNAKKKGVNSKTASNCNINQRAGKLKIKLCTSKQFTMLISILFYQYMIFRGTPFWVLHRVLRGAGLPVLSSPAQNRFVQCFNHERNEGKTRGSPKILISQWNQCN